MPLDDNFASTEQAVEEGRSVFDNLKKTILFILPTNGGECFALIAAIALGTLRPILPLHVTAWIRILAISIVLLPVVEAEKTLVRKGV